MKKNLLAMLLAVVMIAAVVFIAAPATKAADADPIVASDANANGAEAIEVTANCTVDLNGIQGVVINVAEGCTVNLVDSANLEKLDGTKSGSATVNGAVAEWVQHTDNFKYLAVKNGNTYSAHPFNLTVDKYGVNTHYSAVSVRVTVIADDTVAKLIDAGEFGMHNYTAGIYAPHWKTFAGEDGEIATNGLRAYYYLDGSFAENVLTNNLFATVGAYIKIGNTTIESNTKVDIYPEAVLNTLNKNHYNAANANKVVEMAGKAEYLKAYCCNFYAENWAAATCTTAKTCFVCSATEGEALGHNYDVNVVRPTCEAAGSITSTCKVCNAADPNFTSYTQKALGHANTLLAASLGTELYGYTYDKNDPNPTPTKNVSCFITACGANKRTPFKFLDFGDSDTCDVTFYIYNATTDTIKNINLCNGYSSHSFASEADAKAGQKIPGTTVELNLAPNNGKLVTMTIPRECYISNSPSSLTDKNKVSYRDMGLRININNTTTHTTYQYIQISCVSDPIVNECLTLYSGSTGRTVIRRAGTTYVSAVDTAIKGAFASYYEAGYTCVHEAVKKVATN